MAQKIEMTESPHASACCVDTSKSCANIRKGGHIRPTIRKVDALCPAVDRLTLVRQASTEAPVLLVCKITITSDILASIGLGV